MLISCAGCGKEKNIKPSRLAEHNFCDITCRSAYQARNRNAGMKICKKCGAELPRTLEHFFRDSTHVDGLGSACKKCRGEAHQQYCAKNKEKLAHYQKEWHDRHLEYIKDYNKRNGPVYYQKNKTQIKLKQITYNREYIKTPHGRALDIAKKNKRKALKKLSGGAYTVEQWEACLLYFGNKCAYTSEILCAANTNVEHVIPLAKGGTSFIWNIVPATVRANASKNCHDMEEWYKKQAFFKAESLEKIYEWIAFARATYEGGSAL